MRGYYLRLDGPQAVANAALWRQLKAAAAGQGLTLREYILEALARALAERER